MSVLGVKRSWCQPQTHWVHSMPHMSVLYFYSPKKLTPAHCDTSGSRVLCQSITQYAFIVKYISTSTRILSVTLFHPNDVWRSRFGISKIIPSFWISLWISYHSMYPCSSYRFLMHDIHLLVFRSHAYAFFLLWIVLRIWWYPVYLTSREPTKKTPDRHKCN